MAGRRWGARKLPELAPGEHLLWQGGPSWGAVARHVFFVQVIATYFVLFTLANIAITRWAEGPGLGALQSAVPGMLAGGASLLILLALSWAIGRTTNYVLTTERVIMQFGVALPATLSIPLHRVVATAARVRRDHTGDISLQLRDLGTVNFVKLWPHVRLWRGLRAEPMLRDIAQVGTVAPVLCRALVASHARHREDTIRIEPIRAAESTDVPVMQAAE